ncbi:HNH endonuclease [Actinomyces timonensis]|uniref:HNH endonuclease n=1 Tax=Actinomyces timonensis TaxID=1288391 RepID=UPI0004752DCF
MTTRRDSRAWKTLRTRITNDAKQHNLPCAICGLPIHYGARPNQPNAPEVDHIKPWRDAPHLRLDPANLRITHSACNRSRGATTSTPDLGTTSQQWGRPHLRRLT